MGSPEEEGEVRMGRSWEVLQVGRGAVLRLLSITGRIQRKFWGGRWVERAGGASLAGTVDFLLKDWRGQ